MGRTAAGVWALKLASDDAVAAMMLARAEGELLLATERGYAKRSLLKEYPVQGRYGGGVRALDASKLPDTGPVVAAEVVRAYDEAIFLSAAGETLCVKVQNAPLLERATWSTLVREKKRAMALKADDALAAIAVLEGAAPEPPTVTEEEAEPQRPRRKAATAPAKGATARPKATATQDKTAAKEPAAKPSSKAGTGARQPAKTVVKGRPEAKKKTR